MRDIDDLTYNIIGAAIEVHRQMGPGLLESVYQECLAVEMAARGIPFVREQSLPLVVGPGHAQLDPGAGRLLQAGYDQRAYLDREYIGWTRRRRLSLKRARQWIGKERAYECEPEPTGSGPARCGGLDDGAQATRFRRS